MEALFTEENMAELPFEVLQKIQAKIGLKKFRAMFAKVKAPGPSEDEEDGADKFKSKDEVEEDSSAGKKDPYNGRPLKKKKKPKSQPVEMTSKKPVSKFRKVVSNLIAPSRDPRFDELSGTFNEDMFRKSYSFVDEQRGTELKAAMTEMKKTKDEDRREELIKLVQRMKEQSKAQKEKDARRAAKSKRMKVERELVKGGKKPYFLKESDAKTLELVEQFNQAKQDGSLEKKVRTKRKRNESKLKKDFLQERRTVYD